MPTYGKLPSVVSDIESNTGAIQTEETIPMNTSVELEIETDIEVPETPKQGKRIHPCFCILPIAYFIVLICLVLYNMYIDHSAPPESISRDTDNYQEKINEGGHVLTRHTPAVTLPYTQTTHTLPLASIASSIGCSRCFDKEDYHKQTSDEKKQETFNIVEIFIIVWLICYLCCTNNKR